MPPPAVSVSREQAVSIARRHGLNVTSVRQLPSGGIINTVFALNDRHVLRVPRDHPAHIAQARVEAAAIPLAAAAGVRTPNLVAYDESCDVLPVPVLIVEMAVGTDLEAQRANPTTLEPVWHELGRDLGRLHSRVDARRWPAADAPDAPLVAQEPAHVSELLVRRVEEGWFSYVEAEWLAAWLDRLGPMTPATASATHGDVQLSNILAANGSYIAVLDWGCATVKDPVVDFMPLPFAAVPAMLRGHRDVALLPDDEDAERRIVLGRLHTLLAVLPRGPAPGMTWGERPTAWLTDLLHFFQQPPPGWRELAPPS